MMIDPTEATIVATVVSGYSGDPDTRESKQLKLQVDISKFPIGTTAVALPPGCIGISEAEYDRLADRDRWLCALECAGVDNWDGWDAAKDMLAEWDAEDESSDDN